MAPRRDLRDVTAGARSYLCDADPGVFSGVAMRRIRSYHR